jgi:CBS domain containing-hemolysin-like protein
MSADVLLREFGEKRRTVAVVIDEFGGTSGMITMEDLIEEVFGDIEDEHDDVPSITPLEEDMQWLANPDGSYTFGGRVEIYDINERLPFELPEEDAYTTMGGLVVYYAERIPTEGETIEMGEFTVQILKATETRVVVVRLYKSEAVA